MSLMTLYDDDDNDDGAEEEVKIGESSTCNIGYGIEETVPDQSSQVATSLPQTDVSTANDVGCDILNDNPEDESFRDNESNGRLLLPTFRSRGSTLRRSKRRRSTFNYPWLYKSRMKMKAPRNSENRRGSYLARRIARCGGLRRNENRPWSLKEKAKLLNALQTVEDPDDYESVAAHIVTRSAEDVRSFIKGREKELMKNKSYYLELFNMKEPEAPSPLSQWNNICNYQSKESLTKALHEVLKLASFEPQSVREVRMDFSLMYNYLANLSVDKELPELSPLEACLLWDTISDIDSCTALRSNSECINHLKQQVAKLTSETPEFQVSRGVFQNVAETIESDRITAYQTCLKQGLLKPAFPLNCAPNTVAPGGERSDDKFEKNAKERSKLRDAIYELTGVCLTDGDRLRSEESSSSTHSSQQRLDIDEKCFSILNPLSLPAKFLSFSQLFHTNSDSPVDLSTWSPNNESTSETPP